MEFTLKEAVHYSENNRLQEWIQRFLRESEGEMPNPNFALADGLLLEDRHYFQPICIPLQVLKTVRVEQDIIDENELIHYRYKVDQIIQKLPQWDMPPLIAQYNGTEFVLTDGNHRYSALRKEKISGYYTIVWCNEHMKNSVYEIMVDKGWIDFGIQI